MCAREAHESSFQRAPPVRELQDRAPPRQALCHLHESAPQAAAGLMLRLVRHNRLETAGVARVQNHLRDSTMPRILGVDIPSDKPTRISLRYLYGIGPATALEICRKAQVAPNSRAKDLTDDELAKIAAILDREYV